MPPPLDAFINRFGPSEREQREQRVTAIASAWARRMPNIPPPSAERIGEWLCCTDAEIGTGLIFTSSKFGTKARPRRDLAYRYCTNMIFNASRKRTAERARQMTAQAAAGTSKD